MSGLKISLTLILLLVGVDYAESASTSKLQVHIPASLNKADGYDHRDALFGIPPYGSSIQQPMYYANSTFCDSNFDMTQGYPRKDRDEHGRMKPPFILMVDRGDCTFVQKVRNAQRAGASGVLIADNSCLCAAADTCIPPDGTSCETQEPVMADDGSGKDVSIPSFLMFKQDADPLKDYTKTDKIVRIEMAFSVPAPDSRVEYDLWTTTSDPVTRTYLDTFRYAAVALGKDAYFTPHMYIYDGIRAGCKDMVNGENECYTLCTNEGRYCATDPDEDLASGISGADVVAESLRRTCIWNKYGIDDGIGVPWWKYVEEFMFRCDSREQPDLFKSEDCIKDAMKHAEIDIESIEKCMKDAGGVEDDVENSLLEDELKLQGASGVVLIPSLFVNQAPVRGAMSFSTILRAICSGYVGGSEPNVCKQCVGCTDQLGCVKSGSCSSGGATNGGVSTILFAGALLGLTFIFSCVGFVLYRRQQTYMRNEVRGIMQEYMPIDVNQKPQDTSAGIEDSDSKFTIS